MVDLYRAGARRSDDIDGPTTSPWSAGGVGAARFLRGLQLVVPPERIAAVVNTGDDTVLHGLSISPDLDTITYTLAGRHRSRAGLGPGRRDVAGDGGARPLRRRSARRARRPRTTWFDLGDRDLATHLYRTARLAEGATPTEVADEMRRAWGVGVRLLPMTDGALVDDGRAGRRRGGVVPGLLRAPAPRRAGARRSASPARAAPTAGRARRRSTTADAIVIAPSNPIVSIGPVRALPGVDELLAARRERVVAVSPIVGGAALKGPADRMLAELGHEPSVVGVARLYAPIADALVIDPVDADAGRPRSRRPACAPSSCRR